VSGCSASQRDTDGDGVLVVDERDDGPVATIGEPTFEDADAAPSAYGMDAACGCTSAPAPPAGAALLLFLLALGTRRANIVRRCSEPPSARSTTS
jgi:MYXO-CTERM domain-containing protein